MVNENSNQQPFNSDKPVYDAIREIDMMIADYDEGIQIMTAQGMTMGDFTPMQAQAVGTNARLDRERQANIEVQPAL